MNENEILPVFPITVLLIDDQLIIAEAMKLLLADETDIKLHFCQDPAAAINMALKVQPTVILLDLVMPGCDGLTLLKFFRAKAETKDIPIIVLSSKEEPKIKAEAFLEGANDYIVKLPDKIEVLARIRYHSNSYIRLIERNEAFRKLQETQEILNAELAEAATYVRSLLPSPLQGKLAIDWRFIPSTQLGGDAFGYHWIDNDHFAIYLLDVCGHGVGAALLSISVINLLRSQTLPQADFKDPASVLTAINLAFQMEKQNDMFFTIWYGVYQLSKNELLFSNGGHPPAVLLRNLEDDEVDVLLLKNAGIAIGLTLEATFSNEKVAFIAGDVFYLFSDGAYEIFNPKGEPQTLDLLITFLVKAYQFKQFDLDAIVKQIQQVQEKIAFADDFSMLRIVPNTISEK